MNQAELVAAIGNNIDIPNSTIRMVLEIQGKVIADHFATADAFSEREVALPGLGKLKTTTRAARTGRNPQTGAAIEIPEKVGVRFQAGKALNDTINPD